MDRRIDSSGSSEILVIADENGQETMWQRLFLQAEHDELHCNF